MSAFCSTDFPPICWHSGQDLFHRMIDPRANSNSRFITIAVCLCALASVVFIPTLFADPPEPVKPAQITADSNSPSNAKTTPKQQPLTTAQINLLAEELGARSFRTRQLAMKKLGQLGDPAISVALKVGLKTRIEAALRAVGVLKQIYVESRSGSTIDAAEAALLKLKKNAHKSVGRRAAEVLLANYPIRQARAVERIRELGGQIEFGANPFMMLQELDQPEAGFVYAVAVNGSWKGTDEDFANIARIDSLSILYLIKGHKISEKRLALLNQALPELKIQERGRSFLGVGTRLDALGCRIGEVKPKSAAREGGLIEDDIVVEIGGKAVASPEDLIEIISDEEPGQKLKIVVLRTGDPFIRSTLLNFRNDPDAFQPMLAVGILSALHRDIYVTLKPWNINN